MMAGHMPKADTYRLRYNTISKPVSWETTPTNSEMTGNIVPFEGCASGVSYAYNVVQDAESNKCASTDKSVQGADYTISAVGVDGGGHLAPTSPAVDAGNGSSYPAQDMDGDSRPAGGRPDAGADEVR